MNIPGPSFFDIPRLSLGNILELLGTSMSDMQQTSSPLADGGPSWNWDAVPTGAGAPVPVEGPRRSSRRPQASRSNHGGHRHGRRPSRRSNRRGRNRHGRQRRSTHGHHGDQPVRRRPSAVVNGGRYYGIPPFGVPGVRMTSWL